MATQAIANNSNWGCTSTTYNGVEHYGDYKAGLSYDSVVRSGNTVTIKGLKLTGPIHCQYARACYTGCYFGWLATWGGKYAMYNGSSEVKSSYFHQGNYGDYWWSSDQHFSNGVSWGDYSFTVGANDTSKTFQLKGGPQKGPGGAYYPDQWLSFSVSFPKGTKTIKCTATNATFDLKKAGTTVGNDISSYEATWDYNTAYAISDIKAKSGYYLTSQTTDTSGNLTSDKTINVASATKYITFKVTGTNVTFDVKLNNSVVANDQASYNNTTTKQGWSYSVYDIKRKNANYILDSTNAKSGTTSSSDITINAGVASPISLASSITYKTPLQVTSTCTITIDDKSGRTRNWNFVAKLKKGSTVLATITKTTGTTKSVSVTFDRNTTANRLLVDTQYTVEWTINDKTDTFNQTFTSSTNFTLPCLGYIVDSGSSKKISYFTITYPYDIAQDDPSLAPLAGVTKYSFKRVSAT